jgi:hypothetical protein
VIPCEAISEYVKHYLASHMAYEGELLSIIVIGSYAYEEFKRHDSDLDLIVIRNSGGCEGSYTTILERAAIGSLNEITVEMRLFTPDQFQDYAFRCDLPKQFAFVRGYALIVNRSPCTVEAIQLCIDRYWTDCLAAYHALRQLDIPTQIQKLRYDLTDCRNYTRDIRLSANSSLMFLKMAEVIKGCIAQLWAIDCAQQAKQIDIDCLEKDHELLASIGQLRVFNEPRGGRLVDSGKYRVPAAVKDFVESLDTVLSLNRDEVFRRLDELFFAKYNLRLFIDERNPGLSLCWS